MTTVRFLKYHGLGNDFVLLDETMHGPQLDEADLPRAARALCDRHTGIGADGLLLLTKEGARPRMRIVNADGSAAQMCGNGVRCIARHLCDWHGAEEDQLTLLTDRGELSIMIHREEGAFARATIDMGAPILSAKDVPVTIPEGCAGILEVPLPLLTSDAWKESAGLSRTLSAVSMGNPHAVIECADVSKIPLASAGSEIERAPMFPERTNVHFVQVIDRSRVRIVTWERGAGATLACGTGACAVVVALNLRGRIEPRAHVEVPGGELLIQWRASDSHVLMTGPATFVFEGETGVF